MPPPSSFSIYLFSLTNCGWIRVVYERKYNLSILFIFWLPSSFLLSPDVAKSDMCIYMCGLPFLYILLIFLFFSD